MSKFLITSEYGYQRVVECEYYDLNLESNDISVIKIIDEAIKIEEQEIKYE